MSQLIHPRAAVLAASRRIYDTAGAIIHLTKAGGVSPSYSMSGRLYLTTEGWLMLSVPNALGNGAFDALGEVGIEQPTFQGKAYNAHITVMSPEETAKIGANKISERGHTFHYRVADVIEITDPQGWAEVAKVWALKVESPELKKLRKSYGLSELPRGDHVFHVTFGVRKKKVTRPGDEVTKTGVESYIPRNALESVRREGLLSGEALLSRPEALAAAASGRGQTPEQFKADIERILKGWRATSVQGPNVVFAPPPPTIQFHEKHPTRQYDLTRVKVDLMRLLKDVPKTRVHGSELMPIEEYNKLWAKKQLAANKDDPSLRHRDLSTDEINKYQSMTPEELWKNYSDPEGRGYYASDVPHAAVLTPDGVIPPQYLTFDDTDTTETKKGSHDGYHAWDVRNIDAPGLVRYDQTLHESQRRGLSEIRRTGDHDLSSVAEQLLGLLRGHGTKTARDVPRPHRCERQLLPRELPLGYPSCARQQQTEQPPSDVLRGDDDPGRVGQKNGSILSADQNQTRCTGVDGRTGSLCAIRKSAAQQNVSDGLRNDEVSKRMVQRASHTPDDAASSSSEGMDRRRGPDSPDHRTKSAASATGIPNRDIVGDISRLSKDRLYDYLVQKHQARRAGTHWDVRLGDKDTGLYSWAVRKGLPIPGKKHLAVQQPLHDYDYKDFEGTIAKGYGAGTVSRHDEGRVLITKTGPGEIHFSTAHKKAPERFVLKQTRDKQWLLMNTTPTESIPHEKVQYTKVDPQQAESILKSLQPGSSVQAKIDGAGSLTQLYKDKVEVVSYRAAKRTGHPIVHTERIFGCFSGDTLVQLDDGRWRRIDSIRVGDQIACPGGSTRVLAVCDNGATSDWLEVSAGGRLVVTTLNHRFFVMGLGWVPIGLLLEEEAYVDGEGRIVVADETMPRLRQRIQGDLEASDRGHLWSHLRMSSGSAETEAASLNKRRVRSSACSVSRTTSACPDGEVPATGRSYLATESLLGPGAISRRDGQHYWLCESHRAPSTGAGQHSAPIRAASSDEGEGVGSQVGSLAGRTMPERFVSTWSGGIAQETSRVSCPGMPVVRHPSGEDSEPSCSPHPSVSLLREPQRRECRTSVRSVPRQGGCYVHEPRGCVLRIRRLPGLSRRRYDLSVEHPERWYIAGGFVVHNSRPEIKLPRGLAGSVLRGEIYGQNEQGQAIPPQELGGLLNASLGKSLDDQMARKIQLKQLAFDIDQMGSKAVPRDTPYDARLKMVKSLLQYLPKTVHAPQEAKTPSSALRLWRQIQGGEHPLSHEGVVIHPPTGKPAKIKLQEEQDVFVREMFPGLGKYQGKGVGGFRYSLDPKGPVLGEVGSGLSDEIRSQMHTMPGDFLGRVARVRSQGRFPSGALRAPSLIAMHEDEPQAAVRAPS